MKRLIKFRGWQTKQKKMYSAEEMGKDLLTLMPDGSGFIIIDSTSPRSSQWVTQMIPLQWTGLVDKNGVEIYEGDIVEDGVLTFFLEFHKGSFSLKSVKSPMREPRVEQPEDCVVIGNIYTHPHLLTP